MPICNQRDDLPAMLRDAAEVLAAGELIRLGARLGLLENITSLSRRRLATLYRQITGCPPPTGQLPYSADWFIHWQHNLHATAFYHGWIWLRQHRGSVIDCLLSAYRLYLGSCPSGSIPPLTLSRAWMLIRFCDAGVLELCPCRDCGGRFINHSHQPQTSFACCFCQPPSRARCKR